MELLEAFKAIHWLIIVKSMNELTFDSKVNQINLKLLLDPLKSKIMQSKPQTGSESTGQTRWTLGMNANALLLNKDNAIKKYRIQLDVIEVVSWAWQHRNEANGFQVSFLSLPHLIYYYQNSINSFHLIHFYILKKFHLIILII